MQFIRHFMVVAAIVCLSGCGMIGDRADQNPLANEAENLTTELANSKLGLPVDLPIAHVDVMPYQAVQLQPREYYDIGLRVTYSDGAVRNRTLRLAKSVGEQERGIVVTLLGPDGEMIITATQRWGLTSDSALHYYLKEATSSDSLTLHARVKGAVATESYTFNGRSITLTYTRGTPSEDSAGAAFAQFYGDPGISLDRTIDNNEDGVIMMELANDPDFTEWVHWHVIPATGRRPLSKPACSADCVCAYAGAVSWLKCSFGGGIANFVCDAAAGVDIACIIAKIFG